MKALRILLGTSLVFGCCHCKRNKVEDASRTEMSQPSNEIQRFLGEYQKGDYEIDVSRMDAIEKSSVDFSADESPDAKTESYTLPSPKGTPDFFEYHVTRDSNSGEIIVTRIGGVGGVYERFRLADEPGF